MALKLVKPFIKRKQLDAVLQTLLDDLSQPYKVNALLMERMSKVFHSDGGVAFLSPFYGFLKIFDLLGLTPGDTVLVTPFIPEPFVEAALFAGLRLVYTDVEETSPVMSFAAAESCLGEEPKLIYLDSALGYIPDISRFKTLNVPLIEDFSYTLGGFRDLSQAGCGGDFAVYLPAYDTILNAGAGLIFLANGKKNGSLFKEFRSAWADRHLLPDTLAALILSQWDAREKIFEKKRELQKHLFHQIRSLSFDLPKQLGDAEHLGPYYPVLVHGSLNDALGYAQKKAVPCKKAFEALNAGFWDENPDSCPNSKNFYLKTLLFPLHTGLSSQDLALMSKVISSLP